MQRNADESGRIYVCLGRVGLVDWTGSRRSLKVGRKGARGSKTTTRRSLGEDPLQLRAKTENKGDRVIGKVGKSPTKKRQAVQPSEDSMSPLAAQMGVPALTMQRARLRARPGVSPVAVLNLVSDLCDLGLVYWTYSLARIPG